MNRLASETSPYLRQHADNPVHWYAWGPDAFAAAKAADKPVLLSIGYAACHWCHVMAHESFEDDETAALMNRLFVNIKVDREERPDIDSIYMQAVQAMVGHGGWPLTAVLTPEGVPYWGGTYFPRDERPGFPSFKRVLHTVAAAWHDKRDVVERTTQAMRDLYANSSVAGTSSGALLPETLVRAFEVLQQRHDPVHGGFEGAPKFPQTMALDFCLRWYAESGDAAALAIAHRSFLAMARGGIYDQVGGGFARYSVDARWLVPHFEKMLYDNALLIRLGAHLWQVTKDDEIRRVVEQTIAWVAREMTSPAGGFHSSLDADSEGHEGVFYVWDAAEFDRIVGADAPLLRQYWGVTESGNFEGRNILHVAAGIVDWPTDHATGGRKAPSDDDAHPLSAALARAVPLLLAARSARVRPGLDDKVLAGWNGLMTRALAEASRIFGRADWLRMAERNGTLLRTQLVFDARVTRVLTVRDGVPVAGPGFLEDQAAVLLAFLALHESTGEPSWLTDALAIGVSMEARFYDPEARTWYDTPTDGEQLITRPSDTFDNATPAGPSLALEAMLRLSEPEGDERRRSDAIMALSRFGEAMSRWPNGFGHLLGVLDMALFGAVAVAMVTHRDASEAAALREVAFARYCPRLLVVAGSEATADAYAQQAGESASAPLVALLAGRRAIDGQPTGYVCRGFVCLTPTVDATELARQLESACHPLPGQSLFAAERIDSGRARGSAPGHGAPRE